MSARFAPVKLKHDESGLSAGDRKALAKLVEAAKVLNLVFMDQLWSGDRALYASLQKDTTPTRQGAAPLLLAEQGALVGPRRTRGVSSPACPSANRWAPISIPRI